DPGNPADLTGYGAVAYPFRIGKYEVTVGQYVAFLNAKAKSDPYGLYDDNVLETDWGFKLERTGEEGAYHYTVDPLYANRPIVKVSFWDACRFANWLHNGQGDGDTETGAYTLNGTLDADAGTIRRNPDARWFIPSEDEWYKAAYYDPQHASGARYWKYPIRSDVVPTRDFGGHNDANFNTGSLLPRATTVVGSFANASSSYGTLDQGGNVAEWTESVERTSQRWRRCQRGGSFILGVEELLSSSRGLVPAKETERYVGFRVAATTFNSQGTPVQATGEHRQPTSDATAELWAKPSELRNKKLIGTGQCSLHDVTPRFLAEHADFCASFPFDGLAVVAPLDATWKKEHGLVGGGFHETLDALAWSKLEVPYAAVQHVVEDLKKVVWGHVTDNFLWYRLSRAHVEGVAGEAERDLSADFASEQEWAVVERNAALAARICREANLKGFMLDTEQYDNYVTGGAYPMGKNTPELVRERGKKWIEAVQAEYPGITIVIFFGWSPDLYQPPFFKGIKPFLDGVLDGIEEPGRLVHAYENTFYYGKGAGAWNIPEGFPGDRSRFQETKDSIKKWGILSGDPEKYQRFVRAATAAWIESDPWDLWSGWGAGSAFTGWSNAPLALAYSDEYVWVWSEHTNYCHSHLLSSHGMEPDGETAQGRPPDPGFNPFLASLANQTFNTGHEAATSLTEDFSTNSLLRGWYFDFDIMDVGRRVEAHHAAQIFSADAVPYVWSAADRAVRVQGTWMTGARGETAAQLGLQRRRYVHPLAPLSQEDVFHAELDFRLERLGADPSNPIVMGLFNSNELVNRKSLIARIDNLSTLDVMMVGDGEPTLVQLEVPGGLKPGSDYRIAIHFDGVNNQLRVSLFDLSSPSQVIAQGSVQIPENLGLFQMDEIGVAQWDAHATATEPAQAYQYLLKRVSVERTPALWASPQELRKKKVIGAGQYSTLNLTDENAPTPSFLASHPEYLANHPFDGIAVPVVLENDWCRQQGLNESVYDLHSMVMTTLPITYSELQEARQDLQKVQWAHVTDNFLWYGVRDGSRGGDTDRSYTVDSDSTQDWNIVTQTAGHCARLCRESGLQGFIFDTEMYTDYKSGEHYPFGLGTPEVWRARGQKWIQAVQKEYPGIKILFFFSWGPERDVWPGYANLTHFMNGILADIQSPARLIHGWESTFWFGGKRILPGGIPYVYPGDRAAFATARHDVKYAWRSYCDNPVKYEQFVESGLAAWVESDPYNLYPGQPSGYRTELPWSNLPYTLAYSDEYVWVWSQQSHYPATREVLNPFLASIANQTFNTEQEAVDTLADDFDVDPLRRGWYFDFDMLDIGRDPQTGHLPVMSTETVPYVWSPDHRAVRVMGTFMTGVAGTQVAQLGQQRRRFVHPLRPLNQNESFQAEFDVKIENLGTDPNNPIVLGLFHNTQLIHQQTLHLQVRGAESIRLTLAGRQLPFTQDLVLKNGALKAGRTYRMTLVHDAPSHRIECRLTDTTNQSVVVDFSHAIPSNVGTFEFDEAGVAQWDVTSTHTPLDQAYTYWLERISLERKQ
ncbi:MAG: SUMF1/EgtB/PvdO family nonheme iron enzyme, partial [Planctomycetota bacterium]|nr:SUMF1/EgtB/PvdO family nonheme iron enzyme [Planctomycetota bacterium]